MVNRQQFYFVVIGILLSFNIIFGQNTANTNSIPKLFISDVSNAFDVGVATFKQPLEFSQNDWLTVGSIVGGTALLFTADKSIRKFALANHTNFNNKIFNFDFFYGNGYTAIFTVGLYGIGLFSGSSKIRELGLHASEAFIISGLVTGILKLIIGRRRPYAGDSQLFFKPFQLTNNDFQALPSGHTTVVFAVSTVMANYLDNIYWKSFWYGAAGMVALSRIYHNKHWASDIFLGTAVGYFIGKFVVDFNKGKDSQISNLNIAPYFSFDKVGFQIRF